MNRALEARLRKLETKWLPEVAVLFLAWGEDEEEHLSPSRSPVPPARSGKAT